MSIYFIGVDLGTSGIKAGVVDIEGNIIADEYWDAELTSSGPGHMEQNPDSYCTKTLQIIKTAVGKAGISEKEIAGLSIDGQMGGIIGIDKDFNSITGLDMGLDIRSEKYNAFIHKEYGEEIAGITCGSPRNTPKMMLWAREHPDVYKKIYKFVTLSGYVTGKISGLHGDEAFIDYTLLSFFGNENARTLSWSLELTDAFDLDSDKLPTVVEPWRLVGKLTSDAAAAAGLTAGLPVIAGAGDQPAGLLGLGFFSPGRLLDVSGSTTLLYFSTEQYVPDTGRHGVMYMPAIVPEKYTAFTYINGGGINLKWFRDEFAEGMSWEDLTVQAEALQPGSGGLLFIPYLGGRQCPYNAELRGGWIGLNWGHKKEHMFRAVLEGLTFDYALGLEFIRDLFPKVQPLSLDGTGGGSKNSFWNKLKADVLGIPYQQLGDYQYAIRGCGILVGYALGMYDDLQKTAEKMNRNIEKHIFMPTMADTETYRAFIDVFKNAGTGTLEEIMSSLYGLV
jgi:xylulokinase